MGRTTLYMRMGLSSPCVDMGKKTQWNMVVNGRMESWESGENGKLILFPHDMNMKILLVEWACGKGLTVLPHPPLLSNNFPN